MWGVTTRIATSPRFLESESNRVLNVSSRVPSLIVPDSSPSPASFESESRLLWLESESESR